MLNPQNGSSDMGEYVLRTRLVDNPGIEFYYKGTAKEKDASLALNTIVAFEISDAVKMEWDDACILCDLLNADKESLKSKGYEAFEVVMVF